MADRPRFVLVHAPLLGPAAWRWVADELERAGHVAPIPSLHDIKRPASLDAFAEMLASTVADGDILVGHSGAGPLLPYAARDAGLADVRYVFVDAALPPPTGQFVMSEPFRSSLDERAEADGLMPPWHTWWGEDGMRYMVPSAERRAALIADIQRVPPSFGDTERAVPEGWTASPGGYVLLSEIYRSWAETAYSYGWPVEEVLGTHLELVNRPGAVADAILRVAR